MCILKVYSNVDSFESFSKKTDIPVYSLHNKGDIKYKDKKYSSYRISFGVSEKEWDDFEGQISDAILFLEKHYEQIQLLNDTITISDAYLDFPLWSRLDENIANQNNHIPRQLIRIAGKLNIGIEVAIYSKDAFEFDSQTK